MQEQMSEKVPHCLLQKKKRSEPKGYPVRDSIQHSDSMDTICCHPCLRQQTNKRCRFSNCVSFVCVETISHDFKEGLGLLDVLLHLGSFALLKLSGAIITFASFQLDTAQHVRPLTLYRLHHACLTDREDDEREKIFSRIPPPLRQSCSLSFCATAKHTTTPNLND